MSRQQAAVLEDVQAARERVSAEVPASPLVRYGGEAPCEIYLKLENLQPVGSFKLRGSLNALAQLDERARQAGVWTASAGNMGYALAWAARKLSVPCTVVAPEDAPPVKLAAIRREGAEVFQVSFGDYQRIQNAKQWVAAGIPAPAAVRQGGLVHPFADPAVIAGNGTLGLELLEQLDRFDAVIAPYGGGGLSCGIASALKARRPTVKVFASEVDSGAPLAASLAAGKPVRVPYQASFISGMGAPFVFDEMWPLAQELLDGSIVVSPAEAAEAVRQLAVHNRVIAEGAAGSALAAALKLKGDYRRVVVVVSGGNIDSRTFGAILDGRVPQ